MNTQSIYLCVLSLSQSNIRSLNSVRKIFMVIYLDVITDVERPFKRYLYRFDQLSFG